jgi:hypothetical protein
MRNPFTHYFKVNSLPGFRVSDETSVVPKPFQLCA